MVTFHVIKKHEISLMKLPVSLWIIQNLRGLHGTKEDLSAISSLLETLFISATYAIANNVVSKERLPGSQSLNSGSVISLGNLSPRLASVTWPKKYVVRI